MAYISSKILNNLGINPLGNQKNTEKDIYNSNVVHQKVSQDAGSTADAQNGTALTGPSNKNLATDAANAVAGTNAGKTPTSGNASGNAANGALAGLFGTGLSGNISGKSTGGSGSGASSSGSAANPNQQYIDQLNSLYEQILNRGKFSYDLQGDPLYRQYADQYTQLGQQAMRDTQAQSAALTGGYGNSWASSASSQAYQQYLNQLNDVIPDLYDRAYQAWQDQGDDLLSQYSLVASHPGVISSMTPQTSSGGGGGSGSSDADIEALLDAIIAGDTGETVKGLNVKQVNDITKSLGMTNNGGIYNNAYYEALRKLQSGKK